MERVRIRAKSSSRASCDDIVLRETQRSRLCFRPVFSSGGESTEAVLRGQFTFQRRRRVDDDWIDIDSVPLTRLPADHAFNLRLTAEELLTLFRGLDSLFSIHAGLGVPVSGEITYVRADQALDIGQLKAANASLAPEQMADLLNWAVGSTDPAALVSALVQISPAELRTLSLAATVGALESAQETWENRQLSWTEEYWQRTFEKDSFLLEHAFSRPIVVVRGRAYVGGKSLDNRGGSVVDFLFKNEVTNDAALIEIKTPTAKLLGREYRVDVFQPSGELLGAVAQVLTYKHTLQREFNGLGRGGNCEIDVFEPLCAVVVGNAADELDTAHKRRSFELFRGQLSGVRVLAFDEIFAKNRRLIDLLGPGQK